MKLNKRQAINNAIQIVAHDKVSEQERIEAVNQQLFKIRKDLKVLDILKNKLVNLRQIENSESYKQYMHNMSCFELINEKCVLDKKQFDMIKEWLDGK